MEGERYAADAALRGYRVRRDGDGGSALVLELTQGEAELELVAEGALRLRAFTKPEPPRPERALERGAWRAHDASVREHGAGLQWLTQASLLRVEVDSSPLRIRLVDRRGAVVAELDELAFSQDGGARVSLACAESERFFGFGEKTGPLDKRGARLAMRNRDPESFEYADPLYVSIPFFLVHRPAPGPGSLGVLLEAFGPSHFDVAATRPDRVAIESRSHGLDLALIPGPSPREVIERFTARVGRTPLPPLWALGHHQSRWGYRSAKQIRKLAAEIRRRAMPTDVIHLDIDYMDGYRVFTWHPKRFPDPRALLAGLAAQGFRVVTIVDPGVKVDTGYPVYADGRRLDVFCKRTDGTPFSLRVWPGEAALPDFNRADVRAWWAAQHRPLLDAGVAGIWNDMNEPAGWTSDLRIGRMMIPLVKQDTRNLVQRDPERGSADVPHGARRDVPHESVRNLYGLQHCRATRDALESRSTLRPFVLTRSGYTGVQRYAAVWTGDNASRWSHLRGSIPMLLNLSLSGVAFCGADIGGFFRNCTPELYARWVQLGALYPFARTHSMWATRRQEPWRFGKPVEAIARDALRLRMRLLPYLYGLFREAEERGAPVWRPLFYEFPDDAASAAVDDQIMLGPSLLLAPVLERGARERELYLPPGGWIGWHDGALYRGPRRLRVDAPLERMPLFARAGSVIPTRSPALHAGEAAAEPCVFEVFPGADAQGAFYEDDGETTAYREGAFAVTPLRLWSNAGGRLRFEIGAREGAFDPPERPLRVTVHACPPPDAVFVDGERMLRDAAPGWSAADGRVDVRLRDRGHGAAVEIAPAPSP